MDRQTEQVLRGFLKLAPSQKKDLIDAINDYLKQTSTKQKQFEESYNKRADLGPLASNFCVCCGK